MPKTYVFADLHGRFDLLQRAIGAIKIHAQGEKHTIISLGDYIDRGPQSAAIITALKAMNERGEIICLKGNHEEMMVVTIVNSMDPWWWIGNGGGATLISYGHSPKSEYAPHVVPIDHLDWVHKLPLMHMDDHRIYVHAGVDPSVPLDKQNPETLTLKLYKDNMPKGHGKYHVVHGHHQHADGPKLYSGRTNLDTYAWRTGRLVVAVFDDDKSGGPVDTIEVLGDDYKEGTDGRENLHRNRQPGDAT